MSASQAPGHTVTRSKSGYRLNMGKLYWTHVQIPTPVSLDKSVFPSVKWG